MNKVLVGLLAGAILGCLDGATAWFYPEARAMLAGIIMGSTIKGILVGLTAGIVARKVNSMTVGILTGLGVGFALALLVAFLQHANYFEIILPGTLVGVIAGYATQKFGARPVTAK
jgi:hypothetical protein